MGHYLNCQATNVTGAATGKAVPVFFLAWRQWATITSMVITTAIIFAESEP